ncbi:hypothetical protein JCM8547_006939 [Rhodosporidiobolus lusitaniae]
MLTDISNRAIRASTSPSALKERSSTSGANNKRPLPVSSEGDALLPKLKRNLASSSSFAPSSPAPSSPFFASNRLDAFNVPSSPSHSSLKPPTSPVNRFSSLASLPPSSPSFGLSSSTVQLEDLASEGAIASSVELKPKKKPTQVVEAPTTLHLERGTVFYFGRKAKKAIPRPSHALSALGSETYIPVLLPKAAKNASRLHCSARLLPSQEEGKVTVEIRVTGMNGMKVDGKLYRKGSVAKTVVEPGRKMSLRFWNWRCELVVAEPDVRFDGGELSSDQSEEEGPFDREVSVASSTDGFDCSFRRNQLPSASQAASPALSAVSSSSSPRAARTPIYSASMARADSLVSSLALDLPGLIASAIVFHPRATVAVDEIIRALLRETGALWRVLSDEEEEVERRKETQEGEDEAVEAWRELVEEVLETEEMFGAIDNTGLKDAAGHLIPTSYYYIPDADSSRDRVAALEPFVKRVRGARAKGGVRYFWARPSLKKNR